MDCAVCGQTIYLLVTYAAHPRCKFYWELQAVELCMLFARTRSRCQMTGWSRDCVTELSEGAKLYLV